MDKKMMIAIVCGALASSVISVVRTRRAAKAYVEAYTESYRTVYEREYKAMQGAYQSHIDKLENELSERNKMLERSTGQTERLLEIIKKYEES